MPIIHPCLSKVVTKTLLVSVITATIVGQFFRRAKFTVLLLLRHAAILLLWPSFLLLCFHKTPIVRCANSTWQILLLQIPGVFSDRTRLCSIRIMALRIQIRCGCIHSHASNKTSWILETWLPNVGLFLSVLRRCRSCFHLRRSCSYRQRSLVGRPAYISLLPPFLFFLE